MKVPIESLIQVGTPIKSLETIYNIFDPRAK